MLTGYRVLNDDWTEFEAAHIFSLAYQTHWDLNAYNRWITITTPKEDGGHINSVQNGDLSSGSYASKI